MRRVGQKFFAEIKYEMRLMCAHAGAFEVHGDTNPMPACCRQIPRASAHLVYKKPTHSALNGEKIKNKG